MQTHVKTQLYYIAMLLSLSVIVLFFAQPKLLDRSFQFLGINGRSTTDDSTGSDNTPKTVAVSPLMDYTQNSPTIFDTPVTSPTVSSQFISSQFISSQPVVSQPVLDVPQPIAAPIEDRIANEHVPTTDNESTTTPLFPPHSSTPPSSLPLNHPSFPPETMLPEVSPNTPSTSSSGPNPPVILPVGHHATSVSSESPSNFDAPWYSTNTTSANSPATNVVPTHTAIVPVPVPIPTGPPGFAPYSSPSSPQPQPTSPPNGMIPTGPPGFAPYSSPPSPQPQPTSPPNGMIPTGPPTGPPGFAPYSQPTPYPSSPPSAAGHPNVVPLSVPHGNVPYNQGLLVDDPVLTEVIPFPGTEMVARVGTEVILACDVLTECRRLALAQLKDIKKKAPPSQLEAIFKDGDEPVIQELMGMYYPNILDFHIQIALFYNDFRATIPKENLETIEKNLTYEFEQREIPAMLEEHGVVTYAQLKNVLETQYGSSLEREKMLFIRRVASQQWRQEHIRGASGDCTYPQMKEYYDSHLKDFEFPGYVEWEQLMVRLPKSAPAVTEKAAFDKIAWMGNRVAGGMPFAEIAQKNSDGATAKNGGRWDKTHRDTLRSKDIEDTLFTIPVGQLSPILRDDFGLHIVRATNRVETYHTPFLEAQTEIRKRIKAERTAAKEAEYLVKLSEKFPVEKWRPTFQKTQISGRPSPPVR